MRDWFASLRVGAEGEGQTALPVSRNTAMPQNTSTPAPGVLVHSQEFCATHANENTETRGTPNREDWLHDYEERAAIHQHDGGLTRREAERLAYEETLLAWHRAHGMPPTGFCAACGAPLDGWQMPMPDGAMVHSFCVLDYGEKWRERAAEALRLSGIVPPTQHSPEWHVGYFDRRRGYAVDEWFSDNADYLGGWHQAGKT